jgi:RNA-directed DNA polymerase
MKEPHVEGVAIHDGPESCAAAREDGRESLTGERTGAVWSRETKHSGAPTPLSEAEGHTHRGRQRESSGGPARSETRGTCGTFLRENREIPTPPVEDVSKA